MHAALRFGDDTRLVAVARRAPRPPNDGIAPAGGVVLPNPRLFTRWLSRSRPRLRGIIRAASAHSAQQAIRLPRRDHPGSKRRERHELSVNRRCFCEAAPIKKESASRRQLIDGGPPTHWISFSRLPTSARSSIPIVRHRRSPRRRTTRSTAPHFPIRRTSAQADQADNVSALIGEIYDAALDPSLLAVRAAQGPRLHRRQLGRALRQGRDPQEPERLLRRRRSRPALQAALLRQVRPARSVHHRPRVGRGRGADEHRRYPVVRRVLRDAISQGMGAAPGAGRFRLRGDREVGNQRRHVRHLPARTRRRGRRRDAPGDAADRSAHPARRADRAGDRPERAWKPRRLPTRSMA